MCIESEIYVYTYIYMYGHVQETCTLTGFVYVRMYVHIHLSIYPCMYVSIYLSTYLSICVCIYICVLIYICVEICNTCVPTFDDGVDGSYEVGGVSVRVAGKPSSSQSPKPVVRELCHGTLPQTFVTGCQVEYGSAVFKQVCNRGGARVLHEPRLYYRPLSQYGHPGLL